MELSQSGVTATAVQNASVCRDRLECARAFGVRQSSGALETGIEGNGRKNSNLPLLVEAKAAEGCRSPGRQAFSMRREIKKAPPGEPEGA
jgi:hypothetical protein